VEVVVGIEVLPATFTYGEGARIVGERGVRALLDSGAIERLGRGLYRKAGVLGDEELAQIALRAPLGTVCLVSALSHHELTDEIPREWDVAIPRGSWAPVMDVAVSWHRFDAATFDVGRGELALSDGSRIGIYSPERSLVDAYRLRYALGGDVAVEALRRWLRGGGQPSRLLEVAQLFPRAMAPIRQALEILL